MFSDKLKNKLAFEFQDNLEDKLHLPWPTLRMIQTCGKTWQPSSFYYEFQRECRGGENKISNVRSYIILRSGEHVTSFTENNSANFSSEKWSNDAFREVYILRIRETTLNQISRSQSSSSCVAFVTQFVSPVIAGPAGQCIHRGTQG